MKKRGRALDQVIVHIILIGLIFAVFFLATAERINGRGVKQQVLEKQTALFIASAIPGMSFEIDQLNINGFIDDVRVSRGKVHISVEGLSSVNGYPYFSPYNVRVEKGEGKFVVLIG